MFHLIDEASSGIVGVLLMVERERGDVERGKKADRQIGLCSALHGLGLKAACL